MEETWKKRPGTCLVERHADRREGRPGQSFDDESQRENGGQGGRRREERLQACSRRPRLYSSLYVALNLRTAGVEAADNAGLTVNSSGSPLRQKENGVTHQLSLDLPRRFDGSMKPHASRAFRAWDSAERTKSIGSF